MSRTKGEQTLIKECIKDLKLAASFVKSIETADHRINLEIQQLAQRPSSLRPFSATCV